MSVEITTAFIEDYKNTVMLLSQQKQSKLAGCVSQGNYTGDTGKPVDQVGEVTATKKTSRHQDTPIQSTPHDARWVYPADYIYADLIDKTDKLRMVADFESPYAMAGAASIERWKDDAIVEAFFADAKTGEKGTTTTSFPSSQQVSVSLGASGATGLNTAKLKRARKLFLAGEVDLDFEQMFCSITDDQDEDLLNEAEVVSKEFNSKPVLEEGKIIRWLGINFKHCQRLATDSSSYRRVPVWVPSGMHLGMWNDVETDIGVRRDKSNSTQVSVEGTFGSTRIEEVKVVELPCSES